MFVIVDPSATERQKHLQRSHVKSYASSVAHAKRKKGRRWRYLVTQGSEKNQTQHSATVVRQYRKLAPGRSLSVFGGDLTSLESRAISFYQRCTAQEWCTWSDQAVLQQYVPQASCQVLALKHAMVSLGAYHEFIQQPPVARDEELRIVALDHANKTLQSLAEDHKTTSMGTLLLVHIVLTLVTSNLNDAARHRAEFIEYQLYESLLQMIRQRSSLLTKSDLHLVREVLAPLIERQISKECMCINAIACLEKTEAKVFQRDEIPKLPLSFDSTDEACHAAELLLEGAAYIQRLDGNPGKLCEESQYKFQLWFNALERYASTRTLQRYEQLSIRMLKVAFRFGEMMIAVMDAKNEMLFDGYTQLYADLIEVLQESAGWRKLNSRSNTTFGLAPGLLCLAANSVFRWCHDPTLRSRLIDTLENHPRTEGNEGSAVAASVARIIQRAEEGAIFPPPRSCGDIPSTRRVILNTISMYSESLMFKLELLRDPWAECSVEEIWVPWQYFLGSSQLTPPETQCQKGEQPTKVIGGGYISNSINGTRYNVRTSRFFFPLPRC